MSAKSAIIKFGYTDHKVFMAKNGKRKHTAQCKFCTIKRTTITENLGVTSGFTRHMKSKMHESKYEEYLMCCKPTRDFHSQQQPIHQSSLNSYTSSSSPSSVSQQPIHQSSLNSYTSSSPSSVSQQLIHQSSHNSYLTSCTSSPSASQQTHDDVVGAPNIKMEFGDQFFTHGCSSTSNNEEKATPSKQEAIEKAIVKDLIVGCSLPASVVESSGFRKFMKVLNPNYSPMPSSTLTSVTLPYNLVTGKQKIKALLQNHSSLSLTVDVWSDGTTRSFLGVTAHLPSSGGGGAQHHNLQSLLLSFQSFTGTQAGERISNAFEDLLTEYNIKNKIEFILNDDTNRMKTAFWVSFPCDPNVADEAEDDVGFIDLEESVDDETVWEDLDEEDSDIISYTLEKTSKKLLPCFAHTLQLVIGEGMVEIDNVATMIAKARMLASLFHNNVVFQERFENKFGARSIPSANYTTGWNSTFHQLKAILSFDYKTLVEDVCGTTFSYAAFSVLEWSQLRELMDILDPFSEATELTQGEQVATISLVVPTVLDLNTHLRNTQDRVCYFISLVSTLQGALVKYFKGIYMATSMTLPGNASAVPYSVPFADKIYLISAVLDPYFELHWVDMDVYVDTDEQLLPNIREDLKNTIQELVVAEALDKAEALKLPDDSADVQFRDGEGCSTEYKPPLKMSRLEAKYENFRRRHRKNEHGESPTTKAQNEVKKYLEQIQDRRECEGGALKFWEDNKERYPFLYPLAVRVLGIPASSTPVERVFSRGGVMLGRPRKHPSGEMMSTIMFLKCNAHLLF